MLYFFLGASGSGKSAALIHEIDQAIGRGEHILTLVPEQFSYEFDRKLYQAQTEEEQEETDIFTRSLYHQLGASRFNQIDTHSFRSLAREIFRRYGFRPDNRENASEMARTALIYSAVLRASSMLHCYGRQTRQPDFIREVSSLFSKLRHCGCTPMDFLGQTAGFKGRLAQKLEDIALIYQIYDKLLLEYGLRDTASELSEAAAVASGQEAFLGDTVFIDEFEDFTPDQLLMLTVIIAEAKDVYIALRARSADADAYDRFATGARTIRELTGIAKKYGVECSYTHCDKLWRYRVPELALLSGSIFDTPAVYPGQAAPHLYITAAHTPEDEAAYACSEIRHLLAGENGYRAGDIILLTNSLEDYQSVLETAMQRYELPYFLDMQQNIDYMPLLIYLRTAIRLAAGPPDTDLFLRLAKTGLTPCSPEEISLLENYCYTWQIKGRTWDSAFTAGEACAETEPLRQSLCAVISDLKGRMKEAQTARAYAASLYDWLITQGVEERLDTLENACSDPLVRHELHEDWTQVWNLLMEILESLAGLFGDTQMTHEDFLDIFLALVDGMRRKTPPRRLDSIMIAQGETARWNAPKVVFLLGVTENVFPMNSSMNLLFSERDCQSIEQAGLPWVRTRQWQLADTRLSAYKQLCAASERLYISYPAYSVTQEACFPSNAIAAIREMFPDGVHLYETTRQQVPGYYASTYRAAYYQFIRSYTDYSVETASIEAVLRKNPLYHQRLNGLYDILGRLHQNPNQPLFTIRDKLLLRRCIGHTLYLSSTSLEAYGNCPFAYFLQYILNIRIREKMVISGLNAGNMIHMCLERILHDHSREEFLSLSDQQLREISDRYAQEFWLTQMGGSFSKSSRELASYQRVVSGLLPMLRQLQAELAQSAFKPVHFEAKIMPGEMFAPLNLRTENGLSINLLGKVDRIDLCETDQQTWLRIVDYKSSRNGKTFSFKNLLYGLDMQMLLYLFSITAGKSPYAHARPAGIFYKPVGRIENKAERRTDRDAEQIEQENYRMTGLMIENTDLLQLMDKNGDGQFLAYKLAANGHFNHRDSAALLPEHKMRRLRDYVVEKLRQTGTDIYNGQIDANPLVEGAENAPCRYCTFWNICSNAEHTHCRQMVKDAEKIMLSKLSDEEA